MGPTFIIPEDYCRRTSQRVDAIVDGKKDYFDLIEPIWEQVSIYDGEAVFLRQFGAIAERQKHVLAAHWCQSEVCNGGFLQFFHNSTGVLCPEAVTGFSESACRVRLLSSSERCAGSGRSIRATAMTGSRP